jgi:hypothetical protein
MRSAPSSCAKLIWLEQNKNFDVPDMRMHKRVVPEAPHSTLIFPDGSMLGCFVIDLSASGVAVSADIVAEIGTVLAVGKVTGTVVRHFSPKDLRFNSSSFRIPV